MIVASTPGSVTPVVTGNFLVSPYLILPSMLLISFVTSSVPSPRNGPLVCEVAFNKLLSKYSMYSAPYISVPLGSTDMFTVNASPGETFRYDGSTLIVGMDAEANAGGTTANIAANTANTAIPNIILPFFIFLFFTS